MATHGGDQDAFAFATVLCHELAHVIQGEAEVLLGVDRLRHDPYKGHGHEWIAACELIAMRARASQMSFLKRSMGCGYLDTLCMAEEGVDLRHFSRRVRRRLQKSDVSNVKTLDEAASLVAGLVRAG